jgi:hypothetical protein
MSNTDNFNDRFHWCDLAAAFLAPAECRLDNSEYVRELAYGWYEEGAFRDCAATGGQLNPFLRLQ